MIRSVVFKLYFLSQSLWYVYEDVNVTCKKAKVCGAANFIGKILWRKSLATDPFFLATQLTFVPFPKTSWFA